MTDVKLDMGAGNEVTFEIEGETFIMGDDNFQVIDLGDPNVSQEVEVVTVEAPSSSSYLQGSGQRINATSKRGKAPALLRNSRRFPQEQQICITSYFLCTIYLNIAVVFRYWWASAKLSRK